MTAPLLFPNLPRAIDRFPVETFRDLDALPGRFGHNDRAGGSGARPASTELQPPPLFHNRPAEEAKVAPIPAGEPAGLLEEPEQPFQTILLHPTRRAFQGSGQKINRPS